MLAIVEGQMELAVLHRLAQHCGFDIDVAKDKGGQGNFWRDVDRYDLAARNVGPVFGLVDLEQATCPSGLILEQLGRMPHANFALRVAVRMTESWLLADRTGISTFLGVPKSKIPVYPEQESDPKLLVVNLARHSRLREVRERIVPDPGQSGVKVGKEYLPAMREFIRDRWDVGTAAENAPSLARALAAYRARI